MGQKKIKRRLCDDDEIVWPLEDEMSDEHIANTLVALATSDIWSSTYAEDGNSFSGDVFIELTDTGGYDIQFKRVRLIELLVDDLSDSVDDINDAVDANKCSGWISKYKGRNTKKNMANHQKGIRLLVRLIRAYREWEATDAKMTWDELKANNLPAVVKTSDVEK